ncbi:MAG: hypothetical protein WC389_15555 [Lutibacter sp.]
MDYVTKLITERANILGLNIFHFSIEKKETPIEKDTTMQIVFSYPYMYAKIHYFDKTIINWLNGDNLISHVTHELCHMITDPLYGKAVSRFCSVQEIEDERERLTDYISNIVCKLTSNQKIKEEK